MRRSVTRLSISAAPARVNAEGAAEGVALRMGNKTAVSERGREGDGAWEDAGATKSPLG
jgi:hypothetical protein